MRKRVGRKCLIKKRCELQIHHHSTIPIQKEVFTTSQMKIEMCTTKAYRSAIIRAVFSKTRMGLNQMIDAGHS